MRPKHTPGPWNAAIQDADSGEKWYDIWSDHGSVAHVPEYARPDENQRTIHADARLIAAAPEMLELLCSCLIAIENGFDVEEERDPFIKMIRAAIAKAEGRDE